MKLSKKSQMLVMICTILALLLLFSYSIETQKNYILHKDKKISIVALQEELCILKNISNSSTLGNRHRDFVSLYKSWCQNKFDECEINVSGNPFGVNVTIIKLHGFELNNKIISC